MSNQFGGNLGSTTAPIATCSTLTIGTRQEGAVEKLLAIHKQEYESAAKYTQVLVGVGYAGFFAVWSATRDQLSKLSVISSATLISISLFVYIAFEIYQMIYRTTLLHNLGKAVAVNPTGLVAAVHNYQQLEIRKTKQLMKVWYWALGFTIGPALVAAMILFYAFGYRLYKLWQM